MFRRVFGSGFVLLVLASLVAINYAQANDRGRKDQNNGNGDGTRLRAVLNGSDVHPDAHGHADFRQRGTRVRLKIEVEDVGTVTNVRFEVAGQTVGTAPVEADDDDDGGEAELELKGAAVPPVAAGTTVSAFDADTGDLIASGTF